MKTSSTLVYEARDNRLNRSLWGHLRYASQYWAFFLYWVWRGILTRYSQTNVGILWAILQPVLSSLVYIVVFSLIVNVSTAPVPYPLFVLTGLIMWTYFHRIVFTSASTIISNLDIITRVRFPREFLPLAVMVESWIDLLFGTAILALLFLLYQQPVTPYMLIAIWPFLALTALALGIGFFFAGLASSIRDLFHIVPILLQLTLYITPILYPASIVPGSLQAVLLLNPLATIFAAFQQTLLFGRFTLGIEMILASAVSLLVLLLGYRFFKRVEWRFADRL